MKNQQRASSSAPPDDDDATITKVRREGFIRMNVSVRTKLKKIMLTPGYTLFSDSSSTTGGATTTAGGDHRNNKKKKKLSSGTTTTTQPSKKWEEEEEEEEEGGRGAGGLVSKIPDWFARTAVEACGGDVFGSPNVRVGLKYGSRPDVARKGGLLFQMNKSPLSICCRSLMQVPFVAHRTHTSNGSIFYVDGDSVYVSCMKMECCSFLLKDRERYICMAQRLERLFSSSSSGSSSSSDDAGCCRRIALSDHCMDTLTKEDVDFLEMVSDEHQRGGGGGLLEKYVMVLPRDMHNSLDGKRTWVRLTESTMRRHLVLPPL